MTNEVLNTIKKRRSIRAYKQDPVAEEALNAVSIPGGFTPPVRSWKPMIPV